MRSSDHEIVMRDECLFEWRSDAYPLRCELVAFQQLVAHENIIHLATIARTTD